jgi:hypothetical protein
VDPVVRRLEIGRDDVEAGLAQTKGQRAAAGADLEDPSAVGERRLHQFDGVLVHARSGMDAVPLVVPDRSRALDGFALDLRHGVSLPHAGRAVRMTGPAGIRAISAAP